MYYSSLATNALFLFVCLFCLFFIFSYARKRKASEKARSERGSANMHKGEASARVIER